jgi:nitrate/nitrite transport system permease protein
MTATVATRTKSPIQSDTIRNIVKNVLPPAIAILVFLILWQIFVMLQGDKATLPSPLQIITDKEVQKLVLNPFFDDGDINKGLGWQLLASLKRVAFGYSLAAVVGVALGMLIGVSPLMYRALDPLFQLLRTIPPLAWLPLSLAAIQKNEPAAIFVIFITAIWPILINTAVGVRQIPQDYNNVARVLQLPKQKYFTKVVFPATVPYIFTGLRIGIGLSWLAIIAAEMLVGGVGIGFFIWDSYNSNKVAEIIIALVYIGLVGLLLDRLVGFIATLVVSQEQR